MTAEDEMETVRSIKRILKSQPTLEGAGVRLKRAFGYNEVPLLDPFLLLDHFGSKNPDDYIAGFPWHPHRGIETVTYMIRGTVEHGDSIGNKGAIGSGDVQWMTAGSGIIHQEMPQRFEGRTIGFQLWLNLPSSQKMTAPRYRDVKKEQIPEIKFKKNVKIKVICGKVNGVTGPVHDIVVDMEYLDITSGKRSCFEYPVKKGNKTFAYVFEGSAYFDSSRDKLIDEGHLVIYHDGDRVKIITNDSPVRFLLVSGKPINQPVAWRGPIVMNTEEELETAFKELSDGNFIKQS